MCETAHGILTTDHDEMGIGVARKKVVAGGQCDFGAVVPTHAIDSNGDHGHVTEKRTDKGKSPKKSPSLQRM
jgi:hypothetical protein